TWRPIVARDYVDAGTIWLSPSRGAQRRHFGTLQKGHVTERLAQLPSGGLDERPARIELPHSGVATPTPAMWPQGRCVPAGLHRHRAPLAHPLLEPWEEAVELTEAARQEIVHVTGLRDPGSKVEGRRIRITLDDRDPVDDVAEYSRGAHPRQAAADDEGARTGHVSYITRRSASSGQDFRVENAVRPALLQVGQNVLQRLAVEVLQDVGGHVAQMWGDDDIVEMHERVIERGLLVEYIQPRAGDALGTEGLQQRRAIHDWSPGSIDEERRGLHHRELLGAE